MKIHHLNCGSLCPLGHKIPPYFYPREVVCHCLLIESEKGLILVDCGLSQADLKNPERLGPYRWIVGAPKSPQLAAVQQIRELGFSPKDVRHIIPTHLDEDHVGAVEDFPSAVVHTSVAELEAVQRPPTISEKFRYRIRLKRGRIEWQTYEWSQGEKWQGFEAVRNLKVLPPEILLVSLPGHTRGHFCVALQNNDQWLFHVGDAYYDRRELEHPERWAVKVLQKSVHVDYELARENQQRLKELVDRKEIRMFSSHDPVEFAGFHVSK